MTSVCASEVLDSTAHVRSYVPRRWCLCRFCQVSVEDEPHALLGYGTYSTVVRRPRRFISDITAVTLEITHLWSSPCPPLEQLWFLLRVS